MKATRRRKIIISYLANHILLPSRNTIGYIARLFSNYNIVNAYERRILIAVVKRNQTHCKVQHSAISNISPWGWTQNPDLLFDFRTKSKQIFMQIFSHASGRFERYFAPRICFVNGKDSNRILFIVVLENFLRESSSFILNLLRRTYICNWYM